MRALALLAGCLACGPTAHEPCVAIAWSRWIDTDVGWICGAAIAPDGTIVVAVGGSSPGLLEIEAAGQSWRRRTLPLPDDERTTAVCGDVVVTPDGERWVTVVFDGSTMALARFPPTGAPTVIPVAQPPATRRAAIKLALGAETLYVAGTSTVGTSANEDEQVRAFVGVVDRTTAQLEIQHEIPELVGAWALVPRAGRRLVALLATPSIDYSDGVVVSIDPARAGTQWRLALRNETGDSGPVANVVGIDDSDILVARHAGNQTELVRYDRSGQTVWRRALTWDDHVVAHHAVALDEVVSVTTTRPAGATSSWTFAELIDPDGRRVCQAPLPLAEFSANRYVLANPDDDTVVVVASVRGDGAEPGLHVAVLQRE